MWSFKGNTIQTLHSLVVLLKTAIKRAIVKSICFWILNSRNNDFRRHDHCFAPYTRGISLSENPNSTHQSIKLTMEIKPGYMLPFLRMKIPRKDCRLGTKVEVKSTHIRISLLGTCCILLLRRSCHLLSSWVIFTEDWGGLTHYFWSYIIQHIELIYTIAHFVLDRNSPSINQSSTHATSEWQIRIMQPFKD